LSLKDVRNFLREHDEDSNIELKLEISDTNKQLLEPLVGFANGLGGTLILGVHPKTGDILGISEDKDTINNWIGDLIRPQLSENYKMTTLQIGQNFVYILKIASSSILHAAKIKDHFVYYIRKGSSTRQLTPEELNQIAVVKHPYRANREFRQKLAGVIGAVLEEISSDLKVADIAEVLSQKGTLSKAIMEAKRKSINLNVFSRIMDFYETLAYMERTVPHLRLSDEEEKCLAVIKEDFYFRVWQDRSLDLSKIETHRREIDSELKSGLDKDFHTDLSLLHVLGTILRVSEEEEVLARDRSSTLRAMFFSYGKTTNDVLEFLNKWLSSTREKLDKIVIEDNLDRITSQVKTYSHNLAALVRDLIDLKDSVDKVTSLLE
jgi:Putative DNA-binding domain